MDGAPFMTRTARLSAAALLLAAALSAAEPSKAKVHGLSLTGTISSVDEDKKTLVVIGGKGKTTTLSWTGATKVLGGPLRAGQPVTLRYLDKDGKHIVTSARVGPPATPRPAGPTPAPTQSPSR